MSAHISGSKRAVWRLKAGLDRRFRSGHPWVYSNELMESPKGIEAGALVELQDAGGKFLARGYGNPASLIAFRALTRNSNLTDPLSEDALHTALVRAHGLRATLNLADVSHRLIFGEADMLPGLIIDRYRLNEMENGSVFVLQAHSAGADQIVSKLPAVIECFCKTIGQDWSRVGIIIRNDISVRKLEGLASPPPQVLRPLPETDLSACTILVAPAQEGTQPFPFRADLIEGQKTGFFLDQVSNVRLAASRLPALAPKNGPLKILDLCCYVGQWSAQLSRFYRDKGYQVEVTAVDASNSALQIARANIEAQGAVCKPLRADVLHELGALEEASYDLVISDPPALIKGRKDVPAGTHAYLQLNTQALRLTRSGGAIIACSCSALLEEEAFLKTLSKAAHRNRATVRWIARGTQGADHPMLSEFSEGRYLKCWIGLLDRV